MELSLTAIKRQMGVIPVTAVTRTAWQTAQDNKQWIILTHTHRQGTHTHSQTHTCSVTARLITFDRCLFQQIKNTDGVSGQEENVWNDTWSSVRSESVHAGQVWRGVKEKNGAFSFWYCQWRLICLQGLNAADFTVHIFLYWLVCSYRGKFDSIFILDAASPL